MPSKYFWPARLAKLLTVQGDSLLARSRPRLPWLVDMLALIVAGSVGILPVRGGLTGLVAGSFDAGYWQSAPRFADGLKAGSGAAFGDSGVLAPEVLLAAVVVAVEALFFSSLRLTTSTTTAATTAAEATTPPAIKMIRRRLACFARRSSWRSSLRLAVARRCSLVGTAGSLHGR